MVRGHRRVVRRSVVEEESPERPAPAPASTDGPVVPNRAAEDCDSGWGDSADSNDRRLREDVPPHW